MRTRFTRLVAAGLALSAVARPSLGCGLPAAMLRAARGTLAASGPVAPALAPERAAIEARLVALGSTPEAAREAADQLTPEDLVVLLGHPLMMQRAGDLDHLTQSYIIGGVLVAGIVVLAIAGSGSVQIN